MSETIDELTITYTDDGIETTQELDKHILTRGAWTTIVFKYHGWNHTKKCYGPVQFSIRRFQKRDGKYQLRSKFNISSEDQARKIIETLNTWLAETPEE